MVFRKKIRSGEILCDVHKILKPEIPRRGISIRIGKMLTVWISRGISAFSRNFELEEIGKLSTFSHVKVDKNVDNF